MKRALIILLIAVFTFATYALADSEWYCPNCNLAVTTAFCPDCGFAHMDIQVGASGARFFVRAADEATPYSVGDRFRLGHWDQDGYRWNGTDDIVWRVLGDNGDGTYTAISEYALDVRKYNDTAADAVWAQSSLRTWLNADFYASAFSLDEQTMIIPNAEGDAVSIPNISQAQTLLASDAERSCFPTVTVVKSGAWNDTMGHCDWWLRDAGTKSKCAAMVTADGAIDTKGAVVNYPTVGVRPVIVVKLGGTASGSAEEVLTVTNDSLHFYSEIVDIAFNDGETYDQVRFAVWSDENGQDDLRWVDAVLDPAGKWTARVDLTRGYRDAGKFSVHVYGRVGDEENLVTDSYFYDDHIRTVELEIKKAQSGVVFLKITGDVEDRAMVAYVWTDENDQDDIESVDFALNGGVLEAAIDGSAHADKGSVNVHVYERTADGKRLVAWGTYTND